jgi:hypothetical protein
MDKIKDWIITHKNLCIYAVAAVLVVVLGFLVWHFTHPPQTVTTESQVRAETPAGVTLAADNAHVGLSADQSQQTADKIKYIYSHDVQPVYTITTTGDKAQTCSQKAQEVAGADFSIVTDKYNPTKHTGLKTLPASSTVELNQYNVQAYKKVLHTVDVGTSDAKSVGEVGYTVSKKISKDGKYIGVGASYNFDNEKAMVKLSYTW